MDDNTYHAIYDEGYREGYHRGYMDGSNCFRDNLLEFVYRGVGRKPDLMEVD